jgi:hypothetical protein
MRIQRQRLPASFTNSPMTAQRLEFLAKRLLHGGEDILTNEPHFCSTTGKQSRILLGSPLYLAIAD